MFSDSSLSFGKDKSGLILATRQTDDSSSVIQIPTTTPPPPTTTTPIIPNRREIRGWVIVGNRC